MVMIMYGELSEWLKVQSWKGCVAKVTKSSNLLLSAIQKIISRKGVFFVPKFTFCTL